MPLNPGVFLSNKIADSKLAHVGRCPRHDAPVINFNGQGPAPCAAHDMNLKLIELCYFNGGFSHWKYIAEFP